MSIDPRTPRDTQSQERADAIRALSEQPRREPPPSFEPRPASSGAGTGNIVFGLILIVIGVVITAATYSAASSSSGGGHYFIAYGPIVVGVIKVFRGLAANG